MGIEFRLGRNDHKVVEDYIAAEYRVLDAITVDAHNAQRQASVVEAATSSGISVLYELMLDRLANPGFDFGPLPYLPAGGVNGEQLYRDKAIHDQLVESSVQFQLEHHGSIVAPHLFTDDALHDDLLVSMARSTVAWAGDQPVRAIVAANRDRLTRSGYQAARLLAEGLASAGISVIELRLSPTGGSDMSLLKIRSILGIADVFREYVDNIILGSQGVLGPTGIALDRVSGFTVGIGMREQYNYTSLKKAQDPTATEHNYGPQAGVYLPSAGTTVTRRMASGLYADTTIRHRLRCAYSCCANNIEGPTRDPRGHYLHSRTQQLTQLLDRPSAWRGRMEQQRLEQAADTIDIINDGHVPPKCYPLKTRTLRSLIAILEPESGEEHGSQTA